MKTSELITTAILMASSFIVSGQTFQKTIGSSESDNAMGVVQTADDGYVTCGSTYNFGNNASKVYLVKSDANGDTVWTKVYNFSFLDYGNAIDITSDGGFIITGNVSTGNPDYENVLLLKVSSDGTFEWAKTIGGGEAEHGMDVHQTSDGGYIVSGYTQTFGAGYPDMYLIKTSSDGSIEWTKTYGGEVSEYAYSIWQNTDGGYIVAGTARSFLPDTDGFLMRTDDQGEIIWCKSVAGNATDDGLYSVQQTADGGFIAAGYTPVGLNYDFLLVKADADGNQEWSKQIGGGGDNYCFEVKQAADGGYAMAGFYVNLGLGADAYLVRTDSEGDTLWTKKYGGAGDDQAKGFTFTNDGGYMICGHTTSSGFGNGDFYNIKTDNNGISNCNEFNPEVVITDSPVTFSDYEPLEDSGGTGSSIEPVITFGGYIQTGCTSVEIEDENLPGNSVWFYPNPADEILNIQLLSSVDQAVFFMYNLLGELVMKSTLFQSKSSLSISSVQSGLYHIEIVDHGEVLSTLRLVVE